ncbi:MAG: potassium channel family protein [Solirubrobacterales bacterium]
MREEDFAPVLGAGVFLILLGTVTYTLGNDWSLAEGFYFSVATLTTSSVANPNLVVDKPWVELFTSFYILIGIGILVEVVRRLGLSFIEVRRQDKARKTGHLDASGGVTSEGDRLS